MSGSCLPHITIEPVQGGEKGQFVSSETQKILRKLLSIPLQRIEDECNKVAGKYRNLWNTKNSSDIMNEYGLPNTTYKDGLRELDPEFLLSCPSTIRMYIRDVHVDAILHEKKNNHDAAAAVSFSKTSTSEIDLQNPSLQVFLPTLEVKDSKIIWIHRPLTSFTSIIIHEFLHLCGEVKGPQRDIVDGVIKHTMIGTEAIEPLFSMQ
jgi:hypothetical protein